MMRRMAAAVVRLAATLLLHFGTPHHSPATPSTVSAMAPANGQESRKPQGSPSATSHVGTSAQHHQAEAEAVALPSRRGHPVEPPPLTADTAEAITSLTAVSGPAHPRTARYARNPGGGLAPTPSTLLTFRC